MNKHAGSNFATIRTKIGGVWSGSGDRHEVSCGRKEARKGAQDVGQALGSEARSVTSDKAPHKVHRTTAQQRSIV